MDGLERQSTFRGVDTETDVVGLIYEATFIPELWPSVLEAVNARAGAASGALLLFTPEGPPRAITTALTREAFERFSGGDDWKDNERAKSPPLDMNFGFVRVNDYLSEEQIARDNVERALRSVGVGWQAQTLVPLPTGEMIGFSAERWLNQGPHSEDNVAVLNGFRPHLAKAGMIAARLRLERAQAAISALEAVGMPSAVIGADGRVLATNLSFEDVSSVLRPAAFGRLSMVDPSVDLQFQAALAEQRHQGVSSVGSIPIRSRNGEPPVVVHILPVAGAVHDILFGGQTLIVVSALDSRNARLPPGVLHCLFDLSPAEAKLAAALAEGKSLVDAATAGGITIKTARTYLDRVFAKTGVHRQAELVALLASASSVKTRMPLVSVDAGDA
ncbi:hypothetical protein QBK99_13565 [Corticibacterium sp. UT-5YL-CI-8]|nr:hypothetical protein [Tianweitania sp. UT-5YL-CI-8]